MCGQWGVGISNVRSAKKRADFVTKPLHTEAFRFHRLVMNLWEFHALICFFIQVFWGRLVLRDIYSTKCFFSVRREYFWNALEELTCDVRTSTGIGYNVGMYSCGQRTGDPIISIHSTFEFRCSSLLSSILPWGLSSRGAGMVRLGWFQCEKCCSVLKEYTTGGAMLSCGNISLCRRCYCYFLKVIPAYSCVSGFPFPGTVSL